MTKLPTFCVIFAHPLIPDNMKYPALITILLAGALLLGGCRSRVADAASSVTPFPIERLDLLVTGYTRADSLAVHSMRAGLDVYLPLMRIASADMDSALTLLHDSPVTTTFGRDVSRSFSLTPALADDISYTLRTLADTLPAASPARLFTIVSPYNQSVVVADSIVLLALNHYMGPDYAAYEGMPATVRALKTPGRIPFDLAEALIRVNYPYTPSDDPTFLERMLYEGAVAAAVTAVTPGHLPHSALAMSEADYKEALQAEADTWRTLSSDGTLYSTSPDLISRLFSSRSQQRDASFTGLRIVESYLRNNPSATLADLLSPDFYTRSQTRLIDARYRP